MLNKTSIHCNIKIQREHFVRGMLGATLFSRWFWCMLSSAVSSASLCQRLSQTLQGNGGWNVSGLCTHPVQSHRFTVGAPACARTNPSWGTTAGNANMQLRLWMKCQGFRRTRSLSYSCLRTRLWPVWHLCWAQQMPVQRRLARETLQ